MAGNWGCHGADPPGRHQGRLKPKLELTILEGAAARETAQILYKNPSNLLALPINMPNFSLWYSLCSMACNRYMYGKTEAYQLLMRVQTGTH